MPKLKTLKQITGERPICCYCTKALKPVTDWFEAAERLDGPPDIECLKELKITYYAGSGNMANALATRGYAPERVFQTTYVEGTFPQRIVTKLRFWCGYYDTAIYAQDDTPLFCSDHCARHFAAACWTAGMRIKRAT
jgi:hypothetical protein